MNAAAAELCLSDVSLLNRRGELLEKARKKVADEGYVFKKGRSRSKSYGHPVTETTPKRPKYDREMREERLKAIDEEGRDISRMLLFKEKRLAQAESGKNYRLCEQVTDEVMVLKSRKRELNTEKHLFEQKKKRATRREARIRCESESSDLDGGPSSSRSTTKSRSVTPLSSQIVSPSLCRSSSVSSPKSPLYLSPRECSGPISPSSRGSRIKPIECESPSDLNPVSPLMPDDVVAPESPISSDAESHF